MGKIRSGSDHFTEYIKDDWPSKLLFGAVLIAFVVIQGCLFFGVF